MDISTHVANFALPDHHCSQYACRGNSSLEGLSPDVARQLEEAQRDGPDLSGMAVMPPGDVLSGVAGPVLMRLGFLGHVSVEPFADPVGLPEPTAPLPLSAGQQGAAVYDLFSSSMVSLLLSNLALLHLAVAECKSAVAALAD